MKLLLTASIALLAIGGPAIGAGGDQPSTAHKRQEIQKRLAQRHGAKRSAVHKRSANMPLDANGKVPVWNESKHAWEEEN